MRFSLIALLLLLGMSALSAQEFDWLTGMALSDESTTAQSNKHYAFDGDQSTHFVSDRTNHAWVGLDLGQKHVVTRIKWSPCRIDNLDNGSIDYKASSRLAIFEGANSPDFMDAIPLYMISSIYDDDSVRSDYCVDVDVSRGFRYVRYIAPEGSDGGISELKFYGFPSVGDDTQFFQPTNLPLVVIHTDSGCDPVDKVTNVNATSAVIYVSKKGKSKIIADTVACTVRGRGNASWEEFPKKPFRIKYAKKVEMPYGAGKFKKWTLISNYGDKTLMRNMLAYDISRRMEMPYTPYCQPVDLMMNGEYKGTYQLCDQLEVGEGRVEIDELDLETTDNPEVTGGYLYEYDGNSSYEFYDLQSWQNATFEERNTYDLGFYTNRYEDLFRKDKRYGNPITIKSPAKDKMAQEHFDYLKEWINSAEFEIYHQSEGMSDIIDVETFARFFITSEFSGNPDTFYETYQYKKRNENKIYFGPCWDFDLAYSNDYRTRDYLNNNNANDWLCFNGGAFIESWTPNDGPRRAHMELYARALLENNNIKQALRENWAYVRTGNHVSTDTLQALVNEYSSLLDASQYLNFIRWPILNKDVHMNYDSHEAPTYQAQVERVKSYISTRINFMDRMLNLSDEQTYELTISNSCWRTLYLPFAFPVPEGIFLYSIGDLTEDNELILEEVQIGRPNRPYLVHGSPGTYVIRGYGTPFEHKRVNGLLVGHSVNDIAPNGSYVLQNQNGKVGFFRVVESNDIINVAANRAYLWMSDSAKNNTAPMAFIIDDYEENGINNIKVDAIDENRVYSYTGQLLWANNGPLSISEIKNNIGSGNYIVVNKNGAQKVSF